jgi:glycerol-3-phosphate dehydrogenase
MPGDGSKNLVNLIPMNRNESITKLSTETFDVCIIGAGASGAGCALDAALRGLKVALIDQSDFAAQTSSKSTKLIHGGVRYLEQAFKNLDLAQLRQVKHGLRERSVLLSNAPHLAHPLGLITPVFHWWEGLYYWIGLKMYDWFAKSGSGMKASGLPSSKWLSKSSTLKLIPGLSPRIHSAILYFDGQMNDARYNLALVKSAAEISSFQAANYVDVLGFDKNEKGQIYAVRVKNLAPDSTAPHEFSIHAKVFLNCTGPYADHLRRLSNDKTPLRIKPSKGVHLTLSGSELGRSHALLIPKTADERMIFAIPFEGKILLGTTDEAYSDLSQEPVLLQKEVNFLLDALQPYISTQISPDQVLAGFGGIRPLLAPHEVMDEKQTKTMLRDHEVETDTQSGLISLLGGKWTTYRIMAKDAIDVVCRVLQNKFNFSAIPESSTAHFTLLGGRKYTKAHCDQLFQTTGLPMDICKHLCANYGDEVFEVVALLQDNPNLSARIHADYPYICAEVVYGVRSEMAMTIRDFMARRIRLEIIDWAAARQSAVSVAKWMGQELGWSDTTQEKKVKEYQALLDAFRHQATSL